MPGDIEIKYYSVVLDCKNPYELAKFYAELLHWDIPYHNEDYAVIGPPGKMQGEYPGISFQRNPDYVTPVWPEEPEAQQQMEHMDFVVNDLEKAVQSAINCGAVVAKEQFSESWRVMIDPAGHPFCLCEMKQVIESQHFALL